MPVVDVDRLREQGRRFVEGFTPGQKAMTILGVIAVVLAGMTFMKWASTPDYAPLYTGLSSQDAGAVTQQLTTQGINFKVTGDGGTIMVSRQSVLTTRISLSAKGIPTGGDSFTLLDKQGITTDQFTRNIDYQRALQGELSKTIESIDTITAASVTLTIPQSTPFVGGTTDKPTAAVLVKTTGGAKLPSSTVNAIVNLIASSIPNMSADDVTVADAAGNVLHAPGMDANLAGGQQMEQKLTYEAAIEKKISDLVAATLGPGHAAVTVAADLDMSKHVTTNTIYTNTNPKPGGAPLPLRNQSDSTTFQGNGNGAVNGVPGVNNNGIANGAVAGGSGNFKETKSTSENAVNAATDAATKPPGTVKKLSVSVLLDSAVVKPADIAALWQPQLIAAAGIQPARDGVDALVVKTIAFDKTAQKAATAQLTASGGNAMFDLIKHFLTLVMIAMVLFFAWRAIKKADANRVPLRVPIDLRELEAPSGAQLEAALRSPAALAERRPIEAAPATIEGEITALIEAQPEEVAQTLRSWLADRRT